MAFVRKTGTRWQGPLFGSNRSAGGLCKNIPVEVMARRQFVYWFNDFVNTSDYDSTSWTETETDASAAVGIVADGDLGQLLVNAGTVDSTGTQTQFTGTGPAGEFVDLATAYNLGVSQGDANRRVLAFEVRCKLTTADGFAWVGLFDTDTTVQNHATGAETASNMLAFRFNAAGVLTPRIERSNSGTNGTSFTYAADTYIRLGMRVVTQNPVDIDAALAGNVEIYKNGRLMERLNTGTIPLVGLCPTFACGNPAGVDQDLTVDYMWVAWERPADGS